MGPTRLIRITSTGNRRRDKRVSGFRLKATVGGVPGIVVNLSLGGASFETRLPGLENGMETTAVISFSDCDLELNVRVIAHEEDETVYGLAYMGLNRQAFDRIQKAVTNPHRGL